MTEFERGFDDRFRDLPLMWSRSADYREGYEFAQWVIRSFGRRHADAVFYCAD